MSLPELTGWLGFTLVLAAGAVPLVHRAIVRRRAELASPTTRSHVVVGVTASAAAFVHAMTTLPALGSPAAIAGGGVALGSGALAFLLLVAHVGVGLRLRHPKLRKRAETRRTHLGIATAIVIVIVVHAVLIMRSG